MYCIACWWPINKAETCSTFNLQWRYCYAWCEKIRNNTNQVSLVHYMFTTNRRLVNIHTHTHVTVCPPNPRHDQQIKSLLNRKVINSTLRFSLHVQLVISLACVFSTSLFLFLFFPSKHHTKIKAFHVAIKVQIYDPLWLQPDWSSQQAADKVLSLRHRI
jgi:hypothetical protein